jgi:putative ABC transport system substrate-binding protein
MRRKVYDLTLCAMLFALSVSAAEAQQQPTKVPRIGYLSSFDPASDADGTEAIRLALRERGHIEGQNIAIDYRYAEGKPNRLPVLAAELVRLKVDIIVTAAQSPTGAAKEATATIPILMTQDKPEYTRKVRKS